MKKLILSIAVLLTTSLCANANIDSDFIKSEQYFLNAGYSEQTAEFVSLTNRDPYSPTDDIYPKKTVKTYCQLLWKKIDPTAFPELNNVWHDTKLNTGITDF